MKTVGLRELKNRLAEYVRAVRNGEVVMVTDRGQVVAEMRTPTDGSLDDRLPPAVHDLARRGLVKLGRARFQYRRFSGPAVDGLSKRLLDEERGTR